MPEPRVIEPRAGEVVGDAPDRRVEILSDHESLNATWSRFGAGRNGADLHIHHEHADLFYVLEGEFTLRLGPEGEEIVLPAGSLACMPAGVVHGFRNGSDADNRYLNLHAPGRRFADYLRALRDGREFTYDQHDPPPDGGRPRTDAIIGEPRVRVDEIAVEERPAEGEEPHVHDDHAEFAYVLEGALALTSDSGERTAPQGSWIEIAAGARHALSSSEPARYLSLRTPAPHQ